MAEDQRLGQHQQMQGLEAMSSQELIALVVRQQDELSQKDRHIQHLTKNAQSWAKKFDQLQTGKAGDEQTAGEQIKEEQTRKDELQLEYQFQLKRLQSELANASSLNRELVKYLAKLRKEINQMEAREKQDEAERHVVHELVMDDGHSDEVYVDAAFVEPTTEDALEEIMADLEFSDEDKAIFKKYSQ